MNLNDSSSSSEEVEEVTGRTRVNWTELENQRLLSAWCHHSIDAVKGTDQKAEHYWKAVAQEFNSNMPSGGHKRIAKQCRTHWDGLKREVAKFSELHSKARSTFTSGYSDDMIMEKTREWYKSRNK